MRKLTIGLMALVMSLALSGMVYGQTTITNPLQMEVSATVADTCVFAGIIDVLFKGYDPISTVANTAIGGVGVKCVNGTTFKIGLDSGSNPSADSGCAGRSMKTLVDTGTVDAEGAAILKAHYLCYGLTQPNGADDGKGTAIWGTGGDSLSRTGDGSGHNYSVYGDLPSQQFTAPEGNYSDLINVSVTF